MASKGLTFYDKEFCVFSESTALLKENIIRILMTRPGERINNLNFGSRLQEYIFSNSALAVEDILSEIKNSIERCEPRITVNNVVLENKDTENEILSISIYAVENSTKEVIDVGVTVG